MTTDLTLDRDVNGAAMAAFLAGGIGAFAMGAFVLLHEAAIYSAPSLYGPAGGLSGRTTCAVLVWLASWAVLHARWKARDVAPRRVALITLLLIAAGVLATFPPFWTVVSAQAHHAAGQASHAVPASLKREHAGIHAALIAATQAPGRTGAAARELAGVLDPHFRREDEIALPPLGLLVALAAGDNPSGIAEILPMTDALRAELPGMLKEHQRIRDATQKLLTAARDEKQREHERFAEALAAHAQLEEEVLYPAAVLVGDVIRARMRQGR